MNGSGERPRVIIVRTGTANLASVAAACERVGAEPVVTDDPQAVVEANAAILPGVGAFGAAMTQLRARGLDEAIRERCRVGRPLLAICLGMQLLCESSDESPGVAGLGVVQARVGRFGRGARVPQMGWNRVLPASGRGTLRPEWMYFANSYRIERAPAGWDVATTEHGGAFVSAMERGAVLACQFHPELSGRGGLALVERWLSMASASEVAAC